MKHTSSFTKYAINFYIIFIMLSLFGYFILKYRIISPITIILLILYVLSLIVGSYIGAHMPAKTSQYKIRLNVDFLLWTIFIVSLLFTLIGWLYIIKHYGSLVYIFAHGTLIREETIGNGLQLKPTLVSYLASLGTLGIPLSLSSYYLRPCRKYIILVILFFILTILGDLQSFGRIGMLFSIFLIFSYVCLCIKKIPYIKYSFYSIVLLVLFMVPKFIRAGSTLEGIGYRYGPYLTIDFPPVFEPFITIYAYYFSGIYALDYLLDHPIDYSYGIRNFSAIYNLGNRIFEFDTQRNSIIADVAYVPFDTNIYTLAGELYMDFGVIGIFIGSLIFGALCGFLFKYNGVFGYALKFVLLAWLFETPIYNIFSFGGYLLCFIILVLLTLFCDAKSFYNYR